MIQIPRVAIVPIQRKHEAKTALKQILTIATQKDVVAWMIQDKVNHWQQGLMACVVDVFFKCVSFYCLKYQFSECQMMWDSLD